MSKTYQQIGDFQSKFRDYLVGRLVESGIDPKSELRQNGEREGQELEFREFKNLVISNREVFRADFGAKVNSLPTWLDDLREIRNKVAHFSELTSEDEKEAEILIKKIAGFAKLSIDVVSTRASKSSVAVGKVRMMSDPDLDLMLVKFPRLSKDHNSYEYKIRRNDLGVGSIWIAKQRDGYKIVTTGNAHLVDAELERLTGKVPMTWKDRNHHGWKSLEPETVHKILLHYSNI